MTAHNALPTHPPKILADGKHWICCQECKERIIWNNRLGVWKHINA